MVTLGFCYNQRVVPTPNISVLMINCNNHAVIDNLPNNIKHIVLEKYFALGLNNVLSNANVLDQNKFSN